MAATHKANIGMKNTSLCVDLDGTLIHTDMLYEQAFGLLTALPLSVLKLPWVLLRKSRAELKQWIAKRVQFDPAVLPYNLDLIEWLRGEHASGQRLVLCTASDQHIAGITAAHLEFFAEVMASDGTVNLEGKHKAKALVAKFRDRNSEYAGNSSPDLEVWRHVHKAIVVNASDRLVTDVTASSDVKKFFDGLNSKITVWAKALRVHQ